MQKKHYRMRYEKKFQRTFEISILIVFESSCNYQDQLFLSLFLQWLFAWKEKPWSWGLLFLQKCSNLWEVVWEQTRTDSAKFCNWSRLVDFLIPSSQLFHNFLTTFSQLSQTFFTTFSKLSQNFLKTFSQFSQNFLTTFSQLFTTFHTFIKTFHNFIATLSKKFQNFLKAFLKLITIFSKPSQNFLKSF